MVGLSTGAWTVLASALAAEFGPQGFGRAFGLACGLMPVASLAPPILAQVKESTGSYSSGLIGLAFMLVMAAGVGLLFREKPAAPLGPDGAPAE